MTCFLVRDSSILLRKELRRSLQVVVVYLDPYPKAQIAQKPYIIWSLGPKVLKFESLALGLGQAAVCLGVGADPSGSAMEPASGEEELQYEIRVIRTEGPFRKNIDGTG